MRLLLDKGIVRRVMEGLTRLDLIIPQTSEQQLVLKALKLIVAEELYIATAAHNILSFRFSLIPHTKVQLSISEESK